MKRYIFLFSGFLFFLNLISGQDVYELDPKYPVHDVNSYLKVYADSADQLTVQRLLRDQHLPYTRGDQLPQLLETNLTYWGKLQLMALDSLTGWTLHFEDIMIGPPAWTKSNGKVDVYAYVGGELLFHQKTGVEYPKKERANARSWVLNSIILEELPNNTVVTLIIKAQGNSIGYPAYFNLSARSPDQGFYHEPYQYHRIFNAFMFGVTFIIFLYFFLQFLYLKERVYLWFSVWICFCMLTQAMTIGLILDKLPTLRFPVWMFIANGLFFTFWFFGRSFINSKQKFPILDKFILGLAFFILGEIILSILYALLFNTKAYFTAPHSLHYLFLFLYAVGSLVLSIILTFKNDLFARYFGAGSLIASIFLIIGTLWSMGVMQPPFRLDPYVTGMFLQIVIYSFGISYRSQKLNAQNQLERLKTEQSLAEIQRMKDLDEIKTRFFANISHEFRTPLALISGPLEQAKKQSDTLKDSAVQLPEKSFKLIKKNTLRLQTLVNQLLDLSKVESGNLHLNLSQGGIIQFLRSHAFSFESMAERQNISLNTHFSEESDTAYFDKDKLEKIANNLLSNAFKYTPEGGAVYIDVNLTSKNLLLEISDTGNGVDKKEIDRIFDRFYRVEGTEAKGSGIGLALTKELVNLHNGQISVHSEKNRGTTFKVRLPIDLKNLPKSVRVDKEPEIAHITEEDELKIEVLKTGEPIVFPNNEEVVLLVEDNQDLQSFIVEILEPYYKVLTANDGLQGERMAFEHIPDLIISDVMMPKKDGYELCSALKNNVKTSHVPIVMLTAKAGQSNKMAGLTQGADAYLTKPFDSDELLLRAKNLIAARKKIWDHFKSLDLITVSDLNLSSVDDKFLQKVVKIINDNIDNELLSVEDIASKVGFSRAQLHRKLKALTNKSAGQLVNEIRLNSAKTMLNQKVGSVSEIAYSVGYSNMSYFTKSFKAKFGVLPSKI
ncbi:hybrid sensor histidine kinase/response regulator transcription factor [Croceitalea rosinachiae]|uniref:histidine kinase n=1 Tax=Croceitalea rosinachiae TaxID=3075596 RepID=A0ABU3AB14_9FLAO|nr:ATP-binding protein [Croceitalea sp. F388]MDT0606106.1 ATP-binding protein [Croceitalea sp. F388]